MRMEFVDFQKVNGENYLGIATIRIGDPGAQIYLKYKIRESREGGKIFPTPPSYKIGEEYTSAIIIDSNYDNEKMKSLIIKEVKSFLEGSNLHGNLPREKPQNYSSINENSDIPF